MLLLRFNAETKRNDKQNDVCDIVWRPAPDDDDDDDRRAAPPKHADAPTGSRD